MHVLKMVRVFCLPFLFQSMEAKKQAAGGNDSSKQVNLPAQRFGPPQVVNNCPYYKRCNRWIGCKCKWDHLVCVRVPGGGRRCIKKDLPVAPPARKHERPSKSHSKQGPTSLPRPHYRLPAMISPKYKTSRHVKRA